MHTLILASASPRRKDLLKQIGILPVVCPSKEEERMPIGTPGEIAAGLAKAKCLSVARQFAESKELMNGMFFLGADTIVVRNGEILGKPGDPSEAEYMLSLLQGSDHYVYTGVAVLKIIQDGLISEDSPNVFRNYAVSTKVQVASMDAEEIREYVRSKDPLDKAGAYGIQGQFARYISCIQGEYANVVGLPVSEVYHTLKEMGFFSGKGGKNEH